MRFELNEADDKSLIGGLEAIWRLLPRQLDHVCSEVAAKTPFSLTLTNNRNEDGGNPLNVAFEVWHGKMNTIISMMNIKMVVRPYRKGYEVEVHYQGEDEKSVLMLNSTLLSKLGQAAINLEKTVMSAEAEREMERDIRDYLDQFYS